MVNFLFPRLEYSRLGIVLMLYLILAGCQRNAQEMPQNRSDPFASQQKSGHRKTVAGVSSSNVLSFRHAARMSTLATVKVKSIFPEVAPLPVPDFYYEFFNKDYVGPYRMPSGDGRQDNTGSASGVLISEDGYIVTNYHVINTAKSIEVILADRHSYPATVVGTDKATDLALLKIEAENLPFIEFGNSDSAAVGDIVLIVGNPLNFTSTVTQGIISYKARNIAHSSEQWTLQSYLQTDGVVNIGNSGGALLDLSGKLLGIVTAIASPNGVYAGYSFAIPVKVVKKTTADLHNYGHVRRGSFGMTAVEMDAETAAKLKTSVVAGILIGSIENGGAADKAGLARGDIITSICGVPVESLAELSEVVACSYPGQRLLLKVVRNERHIQNAIILLGGSGIAK